VSSQDGYCSLLALSKDELGTKLTTSGTSTPSTELSCISSYLYSVTGTFSLCELVVGNIFFWCLKRCKPLICVFLESPANIAKCLPETLSAKAQQSSTAVSTKMSLGSEPLSLTDQEQSSSFDVYPRPLKHRRIIPTALPVSSSPSVREERIVPIAICVPSASPQKLSRISPT
jgi:hypothetical protein